MSWMNSLVIEIILLSPAAIFCCRCEISRSNNREGKELTPPFVAKLVILRDATVTCKLEEVSVMVVIAVVTVSRV